MEITRRWGPLSVGLYHSQGKIHKQCEDTKTSEQADAVVSEQADAKTDHNLVAMTVHLNLTVIRNRNQRLKRWDRENLKAKGGELSQKIV